TLALIGSSSLSAPKKNRNSLPPLKSINFIESMRSMMYSLGTAPGEKVDEEWEPFSTLYYNLLLPLRESANINIGIPQ
ncbi:13019_t:CDS:2, partial [Ambispora gerdemannii]